ncbi:hypothetical protein HPB49_021259 [Dermacentor silvarum]|uniref:Uncharacterized protein n=1 Tax=Dermacentor silvarum TaxID=543639 RepID=A0ACB8E2S9_DERSI|nr:hypothetical protein HPB49_021259 [Dermacentor silvarum]
MSDGIEPIRGGVFLKTLHNIQRNMLVKQVRLLSRAHVEPSNLEKMKVCRATLLFSPTIIAILEYLQKNPRSHEKAAQFQDCRLTITFIKYVRWWYDLHDISGRKSRERPFNKTEGDRLAWLEVDFISYLENVRRESMKAHMQSLMKETYEANIIQ